MKTIETHFAVSDITIRRASMRGWHIIPAYAYFNLRGFRVNADLKEIENGWCASAKWYGVEYRGEGRRQIDAINSLADLIVKAQNA